MIMRGCNGDNSEGGVLMFEGIITALTCIGALFGLSDYLNALDEIDEDDNDEYYEEDEEDGEEEEDEKTICGP